MNGKSNPVLNLSASRGWCKRGRDGRSNGSARVGTNRLRLNASILVFPDGNFTRYPGSAGNFLAEQEGVNAKPGGTAGLN